MEAVLLSITAAALMEAIIIITEAILATMGAAATLVILGVIPGVSLAGM